MPHKKPQTEHLSDLTRHDAARVLNVALTTIDELIRDGRLQSYKLRQRRRAGRRIVRESLEALRNERVGGGAK